MKLYFDGEPVNDVAVSGGDEVYSTEETRIGTWIDGKPLYRKVYVLNTISEINWIDFSPSNDVHNLYGTLNTPDRDRVPLNCYYSDSYYISALVYDRDKIRIGISDPEWRSGTIEVVVEYTKTTD